MTWLSGWLKEVIMVVLLASFVDLILPSRSMERYVKLVLSLLILLTLLSPLIKVLTQAADVKLAGAFNKWNQQSAIGGNKGSLQQIMDQAKQLKSQQQEQSLEWAAQEIAAQMKEQIRKQNGQSPAEVKVVLAMQEGRAADGENALNPYIKGVTVVMQPEAANPKKTADGLDSSTDIRVEPVTPVQVEVNIDPIQEDSDNSGGTTSSKAAGTGNQDSSVSEHAEDIKKMLGNTWGIEPETVVVQSGKAGNRKL
ncbi:stage III sporulation protein AF [Paenibacillus dokdonensis]|uniref:Stage III sporulation protein AF n=1 Tax=Paenibacillus dokdonensis TaxID=2567944 RepID=A0ABU6GXK9_9BACL|nr:stage III sporulation protein AF [Paenibacillus dokdonensis]MEC0243445.1 stage III sporulation protein AF [Paenibacillus dokdonensis]